MCSAAGAKAARTSDASPDENKSRCFRQLSVWNKKNINGYRGYLVPTRGHDISLHVPLYKYNVPTMHEELSTTYSTHT